MKSTLASRNTYWPFLFFYLYIVSVTAQVGINTISPDPGALLDIESSTKGILVPRIDIPDLDEIAPVTGGATQSLLVYNIGTATLAGFYYWNTATTEWLPLTIPEDGDFHTVGTSSAPTAITENVFRTGRVGIGDTTPSYALEVRSDTEDAAVNFVKGGSLTGANYGLQVTNFNSGKGEHVGVRSIVNFNTAGTDTDRHYGLFTRVRGLNPSTGVNTNHNIGVYNQLDFGAGDHTGVFNSLTGTQNSTNIGISNFITNSGNGTHTGTSNLLKNSSGNTGTGDKIGSYNGINNSLGTNYGTFNEVFTTVSGKSSYGTYNDVNSDNGTNYAGWFDAHGTGATYYAAVFNRGHVVANENSGDFDFRIEGQTDNDLFFADASTDNVGIGTNSPSEKFEVNGKIKAVDINFSGIPSYSSNANATADTGLASGDVYRVGNNLRIKL